MKSAVEHMESIRVRGDDHKSHGSARHAPASQRLLIYIAEIVTEDEEGRIAPDEQHEANGYLLAKAPALLNALERAFEILDGIADNLFYGDGQPVTTLDAGQIEEIYFEALSEHVTFETLIRQARREI